MEMANSVGPDQTASLGMPFDQGLHCLTRPVCLNNCLGLSWLPAALYFLTLLCIRRTHRLI